MEFQFRKANFGGFHRQDVVDYLEQTAKAHGQQVAELQLRVAQLEEDNQNYPQVVEENESLKRQLEEAKSQVDSLQAKLKGAEGKNATLTAANQEGQERIFALTPDAEAFRSIKDRAAGMELEAHVRAQKTIDEAERQAEVIRGEVHQWCVQVKGQYGITRGELDLAVTHSLESVKAAQKNLEAITQSIAQKDRVLEQMIAQWAKQDKK